MFTFKLVHDLSDCSCNSLVKVFFDGIA
uniref:Uncharacterized protein n=1 Tax=Arundo donax TaxID=35708 RepID=A0A0A8YN48_ARUDO